MGLNMLSTDSRNRWDLAPRTKSLETKFRCPYCVRGTATQAGMIIHTEKKHADIVNGDL